MHYNTTSLILLVSVQEQQSFVVQISSEKRSLEVTIADLSREVDDCKRSAAELERELEEANMQISQVASTKYCESRTVCSLLYPSLIPSSGLFPLYHITAMYFTPPSLYH